MVALVGFVLLVATQHLIILLVPGLKALKLGVNAPLHLQVRIPHLLKGHFILFLLNPTLQISQLLVALRLLPLEAGELDEHLLRLALEDDVLEAGLQLELNAGAHLLRGGRVGRTALGQLQSFSGLG